MSTKFATLCLIILLIVSPLFAATQTNQITIRVAVLDSSNMPPKMWTWLEYEKAYLRGLDTATFAAKKQGFNIVYKNFFYGNDPLDVINELPKVKTWHPDIILGPHYSNQFLLLKNQFKDILVLSSYASDDSIYAMPSNFYTLSPPDIIASEAMANFINTHFHNRNILIINRSDCKDCNNMSHLFSKMYAKINPQAIISQNNFVKEIEDIDNPSTLLKGYKEGDIIIPLVVNFFNYTDLINKLAPLLENNPTFIATEDNWGNPDNGLPITPETENHFNAYLINPLYFDINSENFRTFTEGYLTLYGAYPKEMVSYVTFMTLTSATDALNTCPLRNNTNVSVKKRILTCYLKKMYEFPNWFRPHIYAAYKLGAGTGELVAKQDMTAYFPKRVDAHHDTD